MSNAPTKKLPTLRFPEFFDEWKTKKLGDIAKVSSGGTPSRTRQEYWNGSIPWITTSQINFGAIERAEQYITQEGLRSSAAKLFPAGSILMALYGQGKTRGKVALLGIEAATNQACAVIVTDPTNADAMYIFYELERRYGSLRKLSNDGSQKNLSGELVKGLTLRLPNNKEQEKIAEFLTAVDKKIDVQQRKISLLKDYKDGIAQAIFTEALRFKDIHDNEYPVWTIKSFVEVFESVPTKSHQILSGQIKIQGDYPVVDQGQGQIAGYSDVASKVFTRHPVVVFGDHTTSLKYIDFKFVIGADGTKLLRQKHDDDLHYLYYFLEFHKILPEGYKRHFSVLRQLRIALPCRAEQGKIAEFLAALDDKVKLEESKLEQAKNFKKSLLQQMFV